MNNPQILLITLEGRENLVSKFPYVFKKNKTKPYFEISLKEKEENKEYFQIIAISPYSTKIMDKNLIEKEFPENFDKILLIKNKKNITLEHNFGEKINVEKDNVINTINFINLRNFSKQYQNLISFEKNSSSQNLRKEETSKFYPDIITEPIYKNPKKIQDPKNILINLWTFEERELLKKSLLSYGYGRWKKIQKNFIQQEFFGYSKKTISELRSYSNSFIKSISDNLNFQNLELRNLLLYILEQPKEIPLKYENKKEIEKIKIKNEIYQGDYNICINSRDWDLNSIRQRAKPWAKRLLIMYRINTFVNNYIKYFQNKIGSDTKSFFDFSTLLNFVDNNLLLGQKPCSWWSVLHDIHLIYSTYYNGYANYFAAFIQSDINQTFPSYFYPYRTKSGFDTSECRKLFYLDQKSDLYSEIIIVELPNADAITRRLKKLVSNIHKYSTDVNQKAKNTTLNDILNTISIEDKKVIINYVKDYGFPYNINTNKISYADLKTRLNIQGDLNNKDLEKFLHLIKLLSFIILYENGKSTLLFNPDVHDLKLKELMDLFDLDLAEEFLRNVNLIYFVRKRIIPQDFINKYFLEFKKQLEVFLETKDKEFYDIHTLINQLKIEIYQEVFDYINDNGLLNIENLQRKLEIKNLYTLMNMIFLFIEFIRPLLESSNPSMMKKRKMEYLIKPSLKNEDLINQSKISFKKGKLQTILDIQKVNSINNIKLPIVISSSLKLISLGKINVSSHYHSEHNLFPIGFKTIRTYNSMINPNQKCEYICEILAGSNKPLYRVTCMDDPDNIIIRDSSSACWNFICKKVNEVMDNKKDKIAVSGTERFGLLDSLIIKLLENMEDAKKCEKYILKNKS